MGGSDRRILHVPLRYRAPSEAQTHDSKLITHMMVMFADCYDRVFGRSRQNSSYIDANNRLLLSCLRPTQDQTGSDPATAQTYTSVQSSALSQDVSTHSCTTQGGT